jgi:hypothetical protein
VRKRRKEGFEVSDSSFECRGNISTGKGDISKGIFAYIFRIKSGRIMAFYSQKLVNIALFIKD